MKKMIVILAGMFLLCSCATGGPLWYKDGATENDFNRDKLECQYQAELATASHSGTGISGGMAVGFRQLELIKNCLRVKGWKDVRKSRSQTSKTEKDSTDLIADSYAE